MLDPIEDGAAQDLLPALGIREQGVDILPVGGDQETHGERERGEDRATAVPSGAGRPG
jgi:hypothetical protein